MPWTTIPAMTTGYLYTAADYNALVKGNLEQLKTRPVARTGSHPVGQSIMSTSSTTWVDITGMNATITTSGSSRIAIWGQIYFSGISTAQVVFTAALDGTNQGDGTLGLGRAITANTADYEMANIMCLTNTVSDAAHTVKLQVQLWSGTGTVTVRGADLMIMEVL